MGLEAFEQLRGSPPKLSRPPVTARVTKLTEDGVWAVPIGGDQTVPVGPCRGGEGLAVDDVCLLVFTQERPWVYATPADIPIEQLPVADPGESSSTELVRADDPRLSDARTPTAHVHAAGDVTSGTLAIARLPVAASGTSSTTAVVRADDSRLSDARTPSAHQHDAGDVTSGTLAIARLPVAASGASSTTAVVRADDSRLSNARQPTAHQHDAGDVATGTLAIARLPVAASGASSTTAVVRADDSRLSDARTPTAHVHAAGDVTSGTLAIARLPVAASGTSSTTAVVRADDSRLSDARTPTAHVHAAGDVTSGTLDRARLPTLPGGRVKRAAAQSCADNASTTIGWDTINFAVGGCTASGLGIYIPVSGYYRLSAQVGLVTAGATGIMHVALTGSSHGTVILHRGNCSASSPCVMGGSTTLQCAAGDTITVVVFHTNGAARNTFGGNYETALSIEYVNPL